LGLVLEGGDPATEGAREASRYIEGMDRVLGALGEPTFKRVVERELAESNRETPPAIAELVGLGCYGELLQEPGTRDRSDLVELIGSELDPEALLRTLAQLRRSDALSARA
jgi:hypothetical protein